MILSKNTMEMEILFSEFSQNTKLHYYYRADIYLSKMREMVNRYIIKKSKR
jgi:hypothetical protein